MFSHRGGILAAVFFAVNAAGCPPPARLGPQREVRPWPTHLGSPRHDVSAAETLPPTPAAQWRRDVGRAVRGSPAIGRDVLVLGLAERAVMLLERETGSVFWRTSVSGTIRGGPLLSADRIFVATEETPTARVYALRLAE